MNEIEDLIEFLKKKGFRDTYQVLMKFKGCKVNDHKFYDELNKFSYYNSFFRIKDKLMEKDLLTIEKENGKKYISLTEKGIVVYNKLVEVNKIINKIKVKA